jgi:hypothetical protein
MPPTEGAMAHVTVITKTSVDWALALIEEVKALLVKMVAIEEVKKAAPPDVTLSLPPFDGQRLSPIYAPPSNHAVFKREHCFQSRGRDRVV